MAFIKTGTIFTVASVAQIDGIEAWNKVAGRKLRHSNNVAGIDINNNQELIEGNSDAVVCDIDPEKYIYIHTTIMASVTLEDPKGFYITRDTERYINSNGDSWTKEQLLNDYPTFMQVGTVFVEHDQNPEHAKGKVLDAIARDMGDTILIDLLFCVDRRHTDLVANIESGIANAVSMGCSTAYTICSICGNKAHNDKEYCVHIAKQKNQMVRCKDNVYRRAAELCYNNTFFDCSIVANPAFAGAVFRRLVAHNKVANAMLANILNRKISSEMLTSDAMSKFAFVNNEAEDTSAINNPNRTAPQSSARFLPERNENIENVENHNNGTLFPGAGTREAAMNKEALHPLLHGDEEEYIIDDKEFDDIPWHDPNNTLPVFDAQQPKGMKVQDIGKSEKKASIVGRLVRLSSNYLIPKENRKASMAVNHLSQDMVGRIVSKDANGSYAIFFPKIGTIAGIPCSSVVDFHDEYMKSADAKKVDVKDGQDGILKNHKGAFEDTESRFQVLDFDDENVTIRHLDGSNMGKNETLPRSNFSKSKVKWASGNSIRIASFEGQWVNNFYRLRTANWNEKVASILDRVEAHVDNVQNDITCVFPMLNGRYAKSFTVRSSSNNMNLVFNVTASNDKIRVDVDAV